MINKNIQQNMISKAKKILYFRIFNHQPDRLLLNLCLWQYESLYFFEINNQNYQYYFMFTKNKEQDGDKKQGNGLLSPNTKVQSSNKNVVHTAGKVGKSHHQFIKISGEHKPEKPRPICLEQLSYHDSEDSAWTSLNGTIYDVTVYISYHPGGKILLDGCGKQCDALFNAHHPWVNATYLLEKYKIGFLTKQK